MDINLLRGWPLLCAYEDNGIPILKRDLLALLEKEEPLTPDAFKLMKKLVHGELKFARPTRKYGGFVTRMLLAADVISLQSELEAKGEKLRGDSYRERAKREVAAIHGTNCRELESCLKEHEEYLREILTEEL